MTIHKVFSTNLREQCLERGTIADFCNHAAINRQQFNRYLSGAALPNPTTMRRICANLGIREEELFAERRASSAESSDSAKATSRKALGTAAPETQAEGRLLFVTADMQFELQTAHPSKIPEGYYFCYFPAQDLENHLVRTLIKVRTTGHTTYFKRVTLFKSRELPHRILAVSKHEGYVVSGPDVSYFVGKEQSSATAISMLVIENRPKAATRIMRGLGMVQGFETHMTCQICMQPIPQEQTNRRRMLSALGVVSLSDPEINPIIRQIFMESQQLGKTYFCMPSLEAALK